MPELTAEQRDAIEKNVGWDNVECIYPVTPVVNKFLKNRDTVMIYFLNEIEVSIIDPQVLKERLIKLTANHQALRSVFLCSTEGENFQVVLREHSPNYFCIDLRALSEGDDLSNRQKDYFRTLIQLDLNRPKDLEREVLFRIGLIRTSEAKSILFFACSHLLLDGTGIAQIMSELFDQVEIHPDREIWRKRMFRLYHEDHTESLKYWQKLLEGCKSFTPLPMKQGNIDQVSPEGFYVVGGKKLYEQIVEYCESHRITIAAFMHYAFGRTLMDFLSVDEVCFYSEGNSRQEVDSELPGMFTIVFPVRLKRSDTLADCQTQLIFSAAHFQIFGISEPDFIAEFGKNCAILNVQNIFYAGDKMKQVMNFKTMSEIFNQAPAPIISVKHGKFEFSFRVYTNEVLTCTGVYNENFYDVDFTKKLPQEFIKQLRFIVKED